MTTGKTVGRELVPAAARHMADWLSWKPPGFESRIGQRAGMRRFSLAGAFSLTMQEEKMKVNVKGYLICPHCGRKTKTKVIVGITKMADFPLWCPWCKKESKVNYP